jgi:alpha-ketoglutarate-dependent taurine dioxygenase
VSRFLIPQDGIVMFDNRRVLHGRRPVEDARRHVIGCFIDDDDLRSSYRLLRERSNGGSV